MRTQRERELTTVGSRWQRYRYTEADVLCLYKSYISGEFFGGLLFRRIIFQPINILVSIVSCLFKWNISWVSSSIKRCEQEIRHFLWASTRKHKQKQFPFPSLLLSSFLSCHRNSSSRLPLTPSWLNSCSVRQRGRDGGWDMETLGGWREEERGKDTLCFCMMFFHRGDRGPRWYKPIEAPYKNLLPFTCMVERAPWCLGHSGKHKTWQFWQARGRQATQHRHLSLNGEMELKLDLNLSLYGHFTAFRALIHSSWNKPGWHGH